MTTNWSQIKPPRDAIFASVRLAFDPDEDPAQVGKLDRVADEMHQDLPQPRRITTEHIGYAHRDLTGEFDILLGSSRGQHFERVVQRVAQAERTTVKFQFPGFDFRKIQDIVDNLQ